MQRKAVHEISTPPQEAPMTVSSETAAAYLECCALGYAESVGAGDAGKLEGWAISKATLHDAGVQLAAALGSLDAAERAELTALRRFRDGVVALRGELAAGKTATGETVDCALAVETIDALLALHSPENGAQR